MVAVTPPNYGQGLHGVVTLYDVVYDLFLRQGGSRRRRSSSSGSTSSRSSSAWSGNQWVNQGVYFLFGAGSPSDLTDPAYLEKLAEPRCRAPAGAGGPVPVVPPAAAALGRRRAARRSAAGPARRHPALLWRRRRLLGHDDLRPRGHRHSVRVAAALGRGGFRDGRDVPTAAAESLEDVPLAEQPAALDRAPLRGLPGRAVPPRDRADVDDAGAHHVAAAGGSGLLFRLNILPPGRGARGRLRPRTHPEICARRRRTARRQRPRHPHPLDGHPLADGRGELPRGLQHLELSAAALVLGGAGAQPGAGDAVLRAALDPACRRPRG